MPASLIKRLIKLLQPSGGTPTTADGMDDEPEIARLADRFSSELHARLVIELPAHRTDLQVAHTNHDLAELRIQIHKLLGAVVYAEMHDLENALRELRTALKSAESQAIDDRFERVMVAIDQALRDS